MVSTVKSPRRRGQMIAWACGVLLNSLLYILWPSNTFAFSAKVAFVGNHVVDFTWDSPCYSFERYRILRDGRLAIAPRSLERAKRRIRQITRRNRGISLEQMIRELNSYLTGWVTYFRYAACKSHLKRLDEWTRRKLRCVRLKQRKRAKSVADFLQSLGVPEWNAWILALSGKGWWRKSGTPQANRAMSIAWFKAQGLVSLSERYAELQP